MEKKFEAMGLVGKRNYSKFSDDAMEAEVKEKDMRIEVFSDEIYYQWKFQNQLYPHSGFGQLLKSKRNQIRKAGEALKKELLEAHKAIVGVKPDGTYDCSYEQREAMLEQVRQHKGDLYKEAHEKIVKRNLKKIAGLKPNMSEKEIDRVLDNDTKYTDTTVPILTSYTLLNMMGNLHMNVLREDTWDVFANGKWVGEIQRNYCLSVNYTPHHGNTASRTGGNLYWYFMFQHHKDSETGEPIVYPNVDNFIYNYHNGEGGACRVTHKGIIREGEYPTEGPTGKSKAIFSPDRFKTIGTAFKYYIEMDIVYVRYQRSLVEGGGE